QHVAVAVQIDTRTAVVAAGVVEDVIAFGHGAEPATVGHDVLVGRVDGDADVVGQAVAELAADVSGVRRVDAQTVIVGAAAHGDRAVRQDAGRLGVLVLDAGARGRQEAGDVVLEEVAALELGL